VDEERPVRGLGEALVVIDGALVEIDPAGQAPQLGVGRLLDGALLDAGIQQRLAPGASISRRVRTAQPDAEAAGPGLSRQ